MHGSYKDEVSPAPENIIERDFTAEPPNDKWLVDITEFRIPAGKVYLSPIIAFRRVGRQLEYRTDGGSPVVHSYRAARYRWPG